MEMKSLKLFLCLLRLYLNQGSHRGRCLLYVESGGTCTVFVYWVVVLYSSPIVDDLVVVKWGTRMNAKWGTRLGYIHWL